MQDINTLLSKLFGANGISYNIKTTIKPGVQRENYMLTMQATTISILIYSAVFSHVALRHFLQRMLRHGAEFTPTIYNIITVEGARK